MTINAIRPSSPIKEIVFQKGSAVAIVQANETLARYTQRRKRARPGLKENAGARGRMPENGTAHDEGIESALGIVPHGLDIPPELVRAGPLVFGSIL